MRKSVILLLFCFSNFIIVSAQEAEYRYDNATQLWRLTENAAGLGIDSAHNRGYAQFDLQHREGDYTRVQQGGQQNQLEFFTERYQGLGRWLNAYGKFRFDMNRTKDRAWCDVMRPYDSNPYFTGSSIAGKYDTQQFDLTAAMSTVALGHWHIGARLDYNVADLSRLRDPRSRSQLLDYKIVPAATYTLGDHTLGLALSYHRRKEKIPGVILVNQNQQHTYYFMTGLGQASGVIDGQKSYSREWVDHRFGGQISYQLHKGHLNSLTSLSMERGTEDAWEDYKYEPGQYISYRYGLSSYNRLTVNNIQHQLDLKANFEEAYADEYRQQQVQEKDGKYTSYSYITLIEYKKRHQQHLFDIDLRYRANFIAQQQLKGYAGMHLALNNNETKHLLPLSSFEYGGTLIMAEGGLSLLGQRLWIDAQAGGYVSQKADLNLSDPTTDYAQQVLLPDQPYYQANYWRGRLEVKYLFPLTLKKVRSVWYLKAYGDYLRTNNHLDQKIVGASFGVYN